MFLVENKQLAPQEIETMDLEFYSEIVYNPETSEDVANKFIEFFNNIPADDDRKYWLGYFRWFTELIWKRLNSFSQDVVINIAITRQIPMAILLDFDVWKEIMWYLAGRTSFQVLDLQELYFRMRKSFLESEAVIGEWKGKNFTIRNAIEEVQKINLLENNSMESAELFSKIQDIFFPKNDPIFSKYIVSDPSVAVDRFIGLIQFFLGVDDQHILYVVDAFLHPNTEVTKEELVPPAPVSPVVFTPQPAPLAQPALAAKPQPPKIEPKKEEPKPATTSLATPPAPVFLPAGRQVGKMGIERQTPAQVKSQIESQFKKDADSNFADIEGVMAKLNELAEKYNDPKIAEMMYFDEKTGRFEWSQ